jgi:hypothetical protein
LAVALVTTWEQIQERRIRLAERRRLLEFLCHNARTPARIGRRVLLLEFLYRADTESKKQKDLARSLGISAARASAALSELAQAMDDSVLLTSPAPNPNPAKVFQTKGYFE